MILYGISNCDTVRKAKKYLENQHADFQFHDFRKDGLTPAHIQQWLNSVSFADIVNKRSTSWRSLDEEAKNTLSSEVASDDALDILSRQPTLIKRPVLQVADKVFIGFKESDYQSLFT